MLITLLLATSRVFAATWPAAADWTAVEQGGAPLTDPCGDVSGSDWWDIVGDATHPAAYTYDDGTNLWFRLRLAEAPYSSSRGTPTSWRSFGWGVQMETDFDT